jgi:hypothetical protein
MRLQFCEDMKSVVESEQRLEIPVDWTSKEEVSQQYLSRAFGNAYDFSQGGQ